MRTLNRSGKPWRRVATCLATLALATAGLSGCTPGPRYVRPSVDVPAMYKESSAIPPAGWQVGRPADTADRGSWWKIFADAQLDELEAQVDVSNQTVRKALANLQQAKAMAAVARADESPQVGASLSGDRSHTSQNVVGSSLAGKSTSGYSLRLDASWEPDLFDAIGHRVDAATARAQASAADLNGITLSTQAELATDYFDVRQTDVEIRLLTDMVKSEQEALDMISRRFEAGVSSQSEQSQAQVQLDTTKAQLIDLGEGRAQSEHAIATLIGKPASNFSLPPANEPMLLPYVPSGLPSDLLQRRPDIAAAERRVAASNADVGEATSAFFPQLVLSASGGLSSSTLGSWAALPSRFWAIGPALIGTLLDGGRRHAQLDSARAGYDGSVADYRQAVLTAFQEVEDNLASLDVLGQELAVQQKAVNDATLETQLAMNRYMGGATDYLDVTAAQAVQLTSARAVIDVQRRRFNATILLVKNIGGLWPAGAANREADQPRSGSVDGRLHQNTAGANGGIHSGILAFFANPRAGLAPSA